MKVVKFRLSGKTAFFKKPDVNTYFYFTYGHIHKVALLGMFGAILGYKGYGGMDREQTFPEFYARLNHIKISIVPLGSQGVFSKKIQVFNNSVGYASKEEGGNLIVKEQWLENPAWDIYIQVSCDETVQLMSSLQERKSVYIPYLGKNDHFAMLSDIEVFEEVYVKEDSRKLDCLFLKKLSTIYFDDDDEDERDVHPYKYEERLPLALNEKTNLYETESFVFTNMEVCTKEEKIYFVDNRLLTFY